MSGAGDCKHFNGVQNDCCDAGVEYKSIAIAFKYRPCMPTSILSTPNTTCNKFYAITKEEEAQAEADHKDAFIRVVAARLAITDIHGTKKPLEFIKDQMPCPVCKSGDLHYTISNYNGHIHGQCTTAKCVFWME